MTELTLSFSDGRPMAAYLRLTDADPKVAYSQPFEDRLVVDFDAADGVVGLEILAPWDVTYEEITAVLAQVNAAAPPKAKLAALFELPALRSRGALASSRPE